jgi:hypothetical protein
MRSYCSIVVTVVVSTLAHRSALADNNKASCPPEAAFRTALHVPKTDVVDVRTCAAGKFPAAGVVASVGVGEHELDLVILDAHGKLVARDRSGFLSGSDFAGMSVGRIDVVDLDKDGADEILVDQSDLRAMTEGLSVYRVAKGALIDIFNASFGESNEDALQRTSDTGDADKDAIVECKATYRISKDDAGPYVLLERHLKKGPHAPADNTTAARCFDGSAQIRFSKSGVSM